MKKKLLSLVLAGAMVASTSVSAFANTQNIEIQPNEEREVEVQVKGDIESKEGDVVVGTIAVTVPTNASFKVDKKGVLTSATMSIVNKGDSKISVIASSFKDTSGEQHINLVKEENIDSTDRKQVSLKLTGGNEDIILTSTDGGKMYKGSKPTQEITSGEGFEIKTVNAHDKLDLQLQGRGTPYDSSNSNGDDAVSDNFKLVLKIKQKKDNA